MSHTFSQIKRVVVYRIGSLGDTLVMLPAFHLVRQVFPDAHITLLTNVPVGAKAPPMEDVLRNTNLCDDTLSYPTSLRDFSGLRKLRSALKRGNYECLVYLAEPKGGIRTSIRDWLFFRFCGIRKIIGVPFTRRTLHPVPVPGSELFTSETARALECIRGLGAVDPSGPKGWDLQLTRGEVAAAEATLRKHAIVGQFLAASVGTKVQANDWEEPNWTRLMERLSEEFSGLPLVLFGAGEETERSTRLMQKWKGPKVNLCGVTSPRGSAAILRGAALMVCHDSGPMHLAATMGVPCVAIFSARNPPGVWYPRGENHTILYHRTPCWGCKLATCVEEKKACILSITVEEVHSAVRGQLARRGFLPGLKSTELAEMNGAPDRLQTASPTPPAGPIPQTDPREKIPRAALQKPSVLLLGNYDPDGQQSMQRFATVMLKELSALGAKVTVIRPEPFFGRFRPGASGVGKWLGYLDKFLVFPRVLNRRIRELRKGGARSFVVHICDHSNAFYTRYLRDVPHLVTCHDMLAVRSALGEIPENPTRWSGRRLQSLILNGLHSAQTIACVSDSTRRDVCRLVEQATLRCVVVEMGLNNRFGPVPIAQARARVLEMVLAAGHSPPAGARYLVHVGGEQWYKNRKGVVEMFCELRRASDQGNLWLMMVGKPLSSELKIVIDEAGLSERVVELASVSHEDLCCIYSAAELLLFPSLQEGFGWPIIEAQACGCRVVTTARPPMNEVGGDAAACVNPEDIRSSLDTLLNVLYENDRQRQARIARGLANAEKYSTRRMIDIYLALYDRAVGRGS